MINAIRAHLAEFGVTAAVGRKGIEELLRVIADPSDKRVPDVVRACLAAPIFLKDLTSAFEGEAKWASPYVFT